MRDSEIAAEKHGHEEGIGMTRKHMWNIVPLRLFCAACAA